MSESRPRILGPELVDGCAAQAPPSLTALRRARGGPAPRGARGSRHEPQRHAVRDEEHEDRRVVEADEQAGEVLLLPHELPCSDDHGEECDGAGETEDLGGGAERAVAAVETPRP